MARRLGRQSAAPARRVRLPTSRRHSRPAAVAVLRIRAGRPIPWCPARITPVSPRQPDALLLLQQCGSCLCRDPARSTGLLQAEGEPPADRGA